MDHPAGIVDSTCAGGTDGICHGTVLVGVDECEQCFPEAAKAIGLKAAFKDGILDAQAVILAQQGK